MKKRIVSLVLTLLMIVNVFAVMASAVEEKDYTAAYSLSCATATPKRGNTIEVKVSIKMDYPSPTFGTVVCYDKNYYEPYSKTAASNFVVASDLADYGSTSVIMSDLIANANQLKALYGAAGYTDEQKAQFAFGWCSFTVNAANYADPTTDLLPQYDSYTHVYTLKLKVKDTAPEDGKGKIFVDPAFTQTKTDSNKHNFIARANGPTVSECTVAAKFGQTISCTDAILYASAGCPHTNTKTINAVTATCKDAGYTGDTYCEDCKQTIKTGSEIAKLTTHTPGTTIKENDEASTCTVAGSYDEVVYCTVCGTEISRTPKANALAAHTPGTAQRENINDATCSVTGSYDEVIYCTVCKGEVSRTPKTISLKEHTQGNWTTITPATCKDVGQEGIYCTVCKGLIDTREIAKLKTHTPAAEPVVTPSTCVLAGTSKVVCSVCGTEISSTDLPLANHTYGSWSTVTPATYEAPGLKSRTCSVCFDVDTEEIPILTNDPADYSAVTTAIENVPSNLTKYTTKSVEALNAAINAVVYGLYEADQETVNGYAEAIQTAIDNLKLIPTTLASYANLDDYIAKYVPAGSNKTNGIYKASELSALDTLIESFDRQIALADQTIVDGYLATLKTAVSNLNVDESKATAEFEITTDKTDIKKDDIITVSIKLKTNYPIYTMMIPVLYDATAFQVVVPAGTTAPKAYLTFTGTLADMYKTDGNSNPTTTAYGRNNDSTYWKGQTQYKLANISWSADSSINSTPITLSSQETVATFKLKAISDTADQSAKIMIHSDWLKTSTCKAGSLAVGRSVGSTMGAVAGAYYDVGQTVDLSKATATVNLNKSHTHTPGNWTIEGTKVVKKCTDQECNEVVESKDLPLASITSSNNVGAITVGAQTSITVTTDEIVSDVKVVDSQNADVTFSKSSSSGVYTLTKTFAATGGEKTFTVKYYVAGQWLEAGTFNMNVTESTQPQPEHGAEVISSENVGTIATDVVTSISVKATVGTISGARLVNDSGAVVTTSLSYNAGVFTLTKTFPFTGSEKTYKVQYSYKNAWYDCDDGEITINVVRVLPGVGTVTATENVGEFLDGSKTTITVSTTQGEIAGVRLVNAGGTTVSTINNKNEGTYTLTKTFTFSGSEKTYKVQYKYKNEWFDCVNGEITINVVREIVGVAKVTAKANVGKILTGTETAITVTTTKGVIAGVRLVNGTGTQVSATISQDGGVYTISKTFPFSGSEKSYKVQYKYKNTWYDCEDGSFAVEVVREFEGIGKVTATKNVGTFLVGETTVITVKASQGQIAGVRLLNSSDAFVSASITENQGTYTISKAFSFSGSEKTYKVQYKYKNVWYDCVDGIITINVVRVLEGKGKVTDTQNVGTFSAGNETVLTIKASQGEIAGVRLVNENGGYVSATITEDAGTYTIAKTFSFSGGSKMYKAQYKYKNTWYDCENGDIFINVIK